MKSRDHSPLPYLIGLRTARFAILIGAALVIGGCASQRPLMPTPSIYALGIEHPYAESLPDSLKTVDVDVLYATDRVKQPQEDGRLDYGTDRDHFMTVGEATVSIGGDVEWADLATDAQSGVRSRALRLSVSSVIERTREPRDMLVYYEADGRRSVDANDAPAIRAVRSMVHEMLRERLANVPRKELLIFVHGVANSFDDSLYTTAELWHYLGREFVPIAYSWPAGHSGLLRGYTYDRESSEFTVFHFKRFLSWLAQLPEVEGIHIVSHSRGTDVVLTSIRELTIEARAMGKIPKKQLKLRNVVIAAPDINLEVGLQRTEREGTVWAAEQWTTYTSPNDKAINISEWLFGGGRLGKTGHDSLEDSIQVWSELFAAGASDRRDSVIQYEGSFGGAAGHNYFRTNPAVASDLVLAVRYGRRPGAEHGRPLQHIQGPFWTINDDYLKTLAQETSQAAPN